LPDRSDRYVSPISISISISISIPIPSPAQQRAGKFGTEVREKVYDDLEGAREVTAGSIPDDALYRRVDRVVLEAEGRFSGTVQTAVVCPPTIYGPGNPRSHRLPELCRNSLEGVVGYTCKSTYQPT
jgi:hypothetical protein